MEDAEKTNNVADIEQLRAELNVGIRQLDRGEGVSLVDLREELCLHIEPPISRFGESV